MERGGARRLSREFKLAALARMAAGENVSALSREFGVRRKLLYQWRDTGGAAMAETIRINRAPVLTLGQAVAGLSAYAKGVSLGIIEPSPELLRERGQQLGEGEHLHVELPAAPCSLCACSTGCAP